MEQGYVGTALMDFDTCICIIDYHKKEGQGCFASVRCVSFQPVMRFCEY
jgi:hypothetical protein